MKTLYIECNMGVAGDMLMSALTELLPEPEQFITRMSQIGIPHVSYKREKSEKCGIVGTHIEVSVDGEVEGGYHHHEEHAHHHAHRSMADIEHIIEHLQTSDWVKEQAMAVYRLIAEAESRVHGREVSQIHFHEVGAMDAIADIVGVCLLIEELHPDRIIASPIHVGSGQVHCAHGILPVPAPATSLILQGVPIYSGEIKGELCTPTGAALLKHFAEEFIPMPLLQIEKTGYGMGHKDFPVANCVRALYGRQQEKAEEICELSCNMDDITGEELAYAMKLLLEHGAREVFTTPIGMKKNRPGILLTCLCDADKRQDMLEVIFRNTTTIGVREKPVRRYTLQRRIEECETPYGKVRVKVSEGYGTIQRKPEYDDLAQLAAQQQVSIRRIRETLHLTNP